MFGTPEPRAQGMWWFILTSSTPHGVSGMTPLTQERSAVVAGSSGSAHQNGRVALALSGTKALILLQPTERSGCAVRRVLPAIRRLPFEQLFSMSWVTHSASVIPTKGGACTARQRLRTGTAPLCDRLSRPHRPTLRSTTTFRPSSTTTARNIPPRLLHRLPPAALRQLRRFVSTVDSELKSHAEEGAGAPQWLSRSQGIPAISGSSRATTSRWW